MRTPRWFWYLQSTASQHMNPAHPWAFSRRNCLLGVSQLSQLLIDPSRPLFTFDNIATG